jgi:hypothetical protein
MAVASVQRSPGQGGSDQTPTDWGSRSPSSWPEAERKLRSSSSLPEVAKAADPNELSVQILKELKLLDSEKDYIDEFTTHYSPVFMEELSNNGYIVQTPTGETNNHNIKNSQKNIIDVNDDDKKLIKNIFRTIAKASHPDKTTNQYKNKLYDEAQIAYDENNLLVLYKIAKKINIEIEININALTLLEKIVEDKKKQLKSTK